MNSKHATRAPRKGSQKNPLTRDEYKAELDAGHKFRGATLNEVYTKGSAIMWVYLGKSTGNQPKLRIA